MAYLLNIRDLSKHSTAHQMLKLINRQYPTQNQCWDCLERTNYFWVHVSQSVSKFIYCAKYTN